MLHQLRQALQGGQAALAAQIAHSAKGASLNCGARSVGEFLNRVEQRAHQGESAQLLDLCDQCEREILRIEQFMAGSRTDPI